MLTPERDSTVEALLLYLQEYLNQQAANYYTRIGQPVGQPVNGICAFQSDLNSVLKLPLLMCYRTGFSGERMEFSTANIEYWPFKGVQTAAQQSGLFTWMAKRLAAGLDNHDQMDEGCLRLLPSPSAASIRYATVRGSTGPLIIPFLRYPIEFEDYDLPA
jgi:hypothetical protein